MCISANIKVSRHIGLECACAFVPLYFLDTIEKCPLARYRETVLEKLKETCGERAGEGGSIKKTL